VASAGHITVEVRANVNPAMRSIEFALEAMDRLHYLPFTRRERFVMWVAKQLNVNVDIPRTPRDTGGFI
jgi:hypothetical protein